MRGWFLSLIAHLAFVFAGYFIWPHVTKTLSEENAVVPVDIVTFADQANVTPLSTPDALPAPTPTEEGAPQETTAAAPPPEAIAAAIDKPKPQPEKTKPQQKFSLDQLSLLIDRSKKKTGNNPNPTAPAAPPGEKPRQGFGAQSAMATTEIAAIQAQMKERQCWRAPIDRPNPERLIVKVRFSLARDGSLLSAPQLASGVAPGDTDMRVAADSALRAVRICAPFQLPEATYSRWRDLTLTFDPREMVQ